MKLSFSNISAIAHYEMKSIQRSWFFKIFALLLIVVVSIFCIVMYVPNINDDWSMRSIGWGIPYSPMILLNLVQSFVVIFLATGLMSKSKKIDTHEVFMTRPISNTEYVMGRVWALLRLFFGIHVILLLEIAILNLSISEIPFRPLAYLVYPLLISFPNLIFIIGMSFFVVTLLRNQAVSLILLLGFTVSSLIYLSDKYYFLFDFNSFRLPMMFSDITGFTDYESILLQRGMFVFLGFSFLAITTLLVNRMPRNGFGSAFAVFMSAVCLLSASYLSYQYIKTTVWSPESMRETTIALNNKYGAMDNVSILKHAIKLEHIDASIACTTQLTLKNETSNDLSKAILYLNPSLVVNSVNKNGQALDFQRDSHVVVVKFPDPLRSGQQLLIEVNYSGKIDESVAYLQVDKKDREKQNNRKINQIPKRHAYLTADYVLLTSEVLWYPTTNVGFRSDNQLANSRGFTYYNLEVTTKSNLIAISQGKELITEENVFVFKTQQPLPQISLVIGDYEKKSIEVDSISYELFNFSGNDYFSSYFPDIQDTLAYAIREVKEKFETQMFLKYPFEKLTLIETPIHFYVYQKMAENHLNYIQPATVFLPEKGGDIYRTNFRRVFKDIKRNSREQQKSEKEMQYTAAKILFAEFFTPISLHNYDETPDKFSVASNYFWFINTLNSKKWVFLDKIISNYLKPSSLSSNSGSRFWQRLSRAEKANRMIIDQSIETFLSSDIETKYKNEVILSRGKMLFTLLEDSIGQNELGNFIRGYFKVNQFKSTTFTHFSDSIESAYGLGLNQLLAQVFSKPNPPSFHISTPELFQIINDELATFQSKIVIENTSKENGLVIISYGKEDRVDIVKLQPWQTKEVYAVMDYKPSININTVVSQNLPLMYGYQANMIEVSEGESTFDGERIVDSPQHNLEIIVDNEDEGFSTINDVKESLLDQYTDFEEESEEEYTYLWRARSSNKWIKAVDSKFYGKHIRSIHAARVGTGLKRAIWETDIEFSGYYDVYAYVNKGPKIWSRNRRKRNKNIDHYKVYHEDGVDDVNVDQKKAGKGWTHLGSFRMEKGKARVELSDEREAKNGFVFADAVKWVKQ